MPTAVDLDNYEAPERHTFDTAQVVAELAKLRGPWPKLCPLPDHPHRADSQPGFNVYPGKGWYCWGCGRGGDAFSFVKHMLGEDGAKEWLSKQKGNKGNVLARAVVAANEAMNTNRDKARDYTVLETKMELARRNMSLSRAAVLVGTWGVPVTHITAWGVGYIQGRYWLPCKDVDGKLVDIRKRSEGGAKPKVLSEKGFGKGGHLFGAHQLAARPDATVVVVGGEKDVIVGSYHLPDYVFVSGTRGEGNWSQATMSDPLIRRRVVVFLDGDEAGRKGSDTVLDKLRRVVVELSCVDWTEGEHGKDIGDLCIAGAVDKAKSLIRGARVVVKDPLASILR